MKNPKVVTINSSKTVKKVIKGLKSGKRYYVRVRTIKQYKGETYIGVVGALKSVKTK